MSSPARILLVTGKGGVGKTTVAAATGLRCAQLGLSTLVVSTDPAHSLADVLDVEIGHDPAAVAENLFAQQLDSRQLLETNWSAIRTYLSTLAGRTGIDRVRAEELVVVPGVDEVLALVEVVEQATSGRFDVVVIDCAPSAETLRLLSVPEAVGFWLERLTGPTGSWVELIGALGALSPVPLPDVGTLEGIGWLLARLGAARSVLTDPQVTSARLVLVPEKVVLAESRRTLTYLSLFGVRVDALVANRVLPFADHPLLASWHRVHADELAALRRDVAPLPVMTLPMAVEPPVGEGPLVELAAALYGDDDPTARLHPRSTIEVRGLDAERAEMRIELALTGTDEIDLGRRGDDLVITVGPYRRRVALPDSLAGASIQSARRQGSALVIGFDTSSTRRA